MECSDGHVRGNPDAVTTVIDALERAGVELVGEGPLGAGGGRGVRLMRIRPPGSLSGQTP
jgi:hypothetical protein